MVGFASLSVYMVVGNRSTVDDKGGLTSLLIVTGGKMALDVNLSMIN